MIFDSPDDAMLAMQEFFELHRVEQVVQALVPAIILRPLESGQARPGATRLGGLPDLPAGAEWPRPPAPEDPEAIARRGNEAAAAEMRAHMGKGLPYAFVGQVDLDEAQALGGAASMLPQSGRLLFFYDFSVGPWESGMRTARVIWDDAPRSALQPLAMPPDLAEAAQDEWREHEAMLREYKEPVPDQPQGTNYGAPPRPMSLQAVFGAPAPASLEIEALPELRAYYHRESQDDDVADFADAYEAMLEELGTEYPTDGWRNHQLLGTPSPEQSDPRYQAVVVTEYGQEFLDGDTWEREGQRITERAREWRLLLQVDLADWSGGSFGEGTVYFLIRAEDLAMRRFDRVVSVYQQT